MNVTQNLNNVISLTTTFRTLMSQENKLFKVADESIYFNDALEAQEYAKNNPGKVVVRNNNSEHNRMQTSMKRARVAKSAHMILEYLNEYIIAQDEAKKQIATTMYYHSLRSKFPNNQEIGKNIPIMLIGPTGSGKTFLVQKACECVDSLFLHVDAASMVPEGIKGYSITSMIKDLIFNANDDLKKATTAVVFLDEIDKLFVKDNTDSQFGAKVTGQLLRLLEGGIVKVYKEGLHDTESFDFPTQNLQFILGGAFQSILDEKQDAKPEVGFAKSPKLQKAKIITLNDLYNSFVPKELLGRMGSIINIQTLTEEDYFKILTQSKSSPLKQFIDKIKFHGDEVEINEETLRKVAQAAAKSSLGARALGQYLNAMFHNALFEASNPEFKHHVITFNEN